MKTCILTVIKNEHLYLDEWIKYHLDIGVDHLFIFEDIDSDSHKAITDKYGDKVSLNNISTILSNSALDMTKRYKITKEVNCQEIYIKNILTYLKNAFDYDWCFVIDVDEFITLQNINLRLDSVMNLYTNYDAVILQWECYGASGYVNKPEYSEEKGVIQTFLQKMRGVIPTATVKSFTKTCYNLKTYKNNFFWYSHQPTDQCNYCRTNFSKDRNAVIYDNIYLRHYITKSWEEYKWKKLNRGYFYGKVRTFDAFFKINPDMSYRKEELLSQLDDEVLVVLPYAQRGAQGNELRLALEGWKKFCKSRYHFVLIGEYDRRLEEEFSWIEFIYEPTLPKKEGQYNPHLDIQHKMEIIYNLFRDKYEGFIWMVDDNYAIKPFYTYEIKSIYFHNDDFTGQEQKPTSYWNHDKWKTRQLLDREKMPHKNYTTHFPCYFEFDRLKEIWDKYNLREESYVVEDLYFNSFLHVKPSLDKNVRLGVWSKNIFNEDFQKAVSNPNIKFICNSVEGWSKELEDSLWEIINTKESRS